MNRREIEPLALSLAVLCQGLVLIFFGVTVVVADAPAAVSTKRSAGVCGSISIDTAWTREQSPYSVTCDTALEPGVTLSVEPGVEILFDPGTSLTLWGTFFASGTPTRPITFTSGWLVPAPGDWEGLHFEAGSSDSRLAECVVEYATTGVHVYAGPGAVISPTVENCTIRHHTSHGITVEAFASSCDAARAEPAIVGCAIEDNGQCGIYAYGHGSETHGCFPAETGSAGGLVARNTLRHNQASGICLRAEPGYYSNGEVWTEIAGNRVWSNDGHGIYLYGDDPVYPRLENNAIVSNSIDGLRWDTVHDEHLVPVVNNTVAANGGDGVHCARSAEGMALTNNLVTGNEGHGLLCTTAPYPQVSYNDVWSNLAGGYAGCFTGTADISADPLLIDAPGGDLRLRFGSPCIDAGTDSGAPATDIEGIARPQGDRFDIGAHEFYAPQIVIEWDGTEVAAGSSFSFGRVEVGLSRTVTFTLGNAGYSPLEVEEIALLPASHFTLDVSETLPLTLPPGETVPFAIRFRPLITGVHTATPSVASDDPDDDPYAFVVTGQGVRALTDLSIGGPAFGLPATTYVFTATVSPAEATRPITYTWRATGHPPLTTTDGLSDVVLFTWWQTGVQSVTVTALNVQNAITRTQPVIVDTPPHADFVAAPTSGIAPLSVVFTNTSAGGYDSSWWAFGDGLTSNLPDPVHVYNTPGTYTVALEVGGPWGSDRISRPAYVVVREYRVYLPLLLRGWGD